MWFIFYILLLAGREVYSQDTDECLSTGLVLTDTQGSITFEDTGYVTCQWLIEAQEGMLIDFNFNSLNLPQDCTTFITVYDGTVDFTKQYLGGNICGTNLPSNFESTSNIVTVTFNGGNGYGFGISYTIKDGCGDDEFRCYDKSCIPIALKCDGNNDCGDDSDEMECAQTNEDPSICGKTSVAPNFGPRPRIVGGHFEQNWPWHVVVNSECGTVQCGGTIVSDRWILSAASCLTQAGSLRFFLNFQQQVTLTASGTIDLIYSQSVDFHPNFNDLDILDGNDVAMILLKDSLTFSENLKPVCLPTQGDPIPDPGTLCVATGAGYRDRESNTISYNVLHTRIPIQETETCLANLNNLHTIQCTNNQTSFPDSLFCAGGNNRGLCDRDYGGPLFCLMNQDTWTQVGIGSYGLCGSEPTFFTKVSSFGDWINSFLSMDLSNDAVCGETLTTESGRISPPNWLIRNSLELTECQWTITVPNTKLIVITFEELHFPQFGDSYCYTNFLRIYDGPDNSSPLYLDRSHCGFNPPRNFIGTTNSVFIHYRLNGNFPSDRRSGFQLSWSAEDKCPASDFQCMKGACVASDLVCDGNYDCTDSSDELTCNNGGTGCGNPSVPPEFKWHQRIVGGNEAVSGSWPWHVVLLDSSFSYNYIALDSLCSGTILNESLILTSASCVEAYQTNPGNVAVIAGKFDILVNESHEQLVYADAITIHPHYNDLLNNIALVHLSEPLTFNDAVQAVCINDVVDTADTTCVATGWGYQTRQQFESIHPATSKLRQVVLPIQDRATCETTYTETFGTGSVLPDSQICAGKKNIGGGVASCKGDTGGPLVCFDRIQATWVQLGVTSVGQALGCGVEGQLGFYTNVPTYYQWINDYISGTTTDGATGGTTETSDESTTVDTELLEACDGGGGGITFVEESGQVNFDSRNLNLTYLSCQWKIEVDASKLIQVDFADFNVKSENDNFFGASCQNLFLEVYDGPLDLPNKFGGNYCDMYSPRNFESTSNTVLIRFNSYNSLRVQASSFTFFWAVVDACPTTEFRCTDGTCISRDWKCNGANDCGDNSDEVECVFTSNDPDAGFEECGLNGLQPSFGPSPRIVGGNIVNPGTWPWHVKIGHYRCNPTIICSGTILTERWILTAASCLQDVDTSRLFVNYGATFADFHLVSSMEIHEGYNHGELTSGNDIAMLQLDTELVFAEDIRPVCLPASGEEFPASGTICVASGESGTSSAFYTISGELSHVRLPIIEESACLGALNSILTQQGSATMTSLPTGQFCAGDLQGGVGLCDYDYGGPLVCANAGSWTQVGLGSYGLCGAPDQPTFFTKISDYTEWINNVVSSNPASTTSNLCGDVFTDNSGAIISPNYPLLSYPVSIYCEWRINIADEGSIYFSFEYFNLRGSDSTIFASECQHYVAFYDTAVGEENLITTACSETDENSADVILAETGSVVVVFNASIPIVEFINVGRPDKGFKLVWDAGTVVTTATAPETTETATAPETTETATAPETTETATATETTAPATTTTISETSTAPATTTTTSTQTTTTSSSTAAPAPTLQDSVTVLTGSTAMVVEISQIPSSIFPQSARESFIIDCVVTVNVDIQEFVLLCGDLPTIVIVVGLERLEAYTVSVSVTDGNNFVEAESIANTGSQCTRSCNNAACISNLDQQEYCQCFQGYEFDSTTPDTCHDIDECADGIPCPENSYCQNSPGGYDCVCSNGYSKVDGECTFADCSAASTTSCQNGGSCTPGVITTCSCLDSFTGTFCEVEIDPCLSFPCLNNGVCEDTGNGAFTCLCTPGYTGNLCGDDVDECSSATLNHCQENSVCDNTVGGYNCPCNAGFRGDGKVKCYAIRLYPYGTAAGDTLMEIGDDVRSEAIPLRFPMPFGEKSFSVMHVISNGLISVGPGSEYVRYLYQPWGTGFGLFSPALISPFWDDFHPHEENVGRVYYQVYDILTQTSDGQELFDDLTSRFTPDSSFVPRYVLKVTWSEVDMHYWAYNEGFSSTFQAIVATDFSNTYLMYLYKEDAMLWETDRRWYYGNNALIGYSNGGRLEHVEYQKEYRPDYMPQEGGTENGVYIFHVTPTISNETVALARQACTTWAQKEQDEDHVISVNLTCPCTPIQALFDPRYTFSVDFWMYIIESYYESWCPGCYRWGDTDEWRYDEAPIGNCFQLINATEGPRCCYGNADNEFSPWFGWWWNGALLSGEFGSRYERNQIPIREDTPFSWVFFREETRFDEQYQQALTNDLTPRRLCCVESESSDHCNLYKQLRPSANCDGYVPRVPAWNFGDPHITTTDGVTYTFNGLGEFHHIYSDLFTLQARTQRVKNDNGDDSDATAFVAFAAKDSTSGVVQLEVDFDNTTGNGVIVKIDGAVQTDLSADIPNTVNGVTVTSESGRFQVSFSSTSNSLSVTAKDFILTLAFTADDELNGGVAKGLLGVWDGDQTNDFTTFDGTVLDFEGLKTTTDSDLLDGTFKERDIYEMFGQTWQVTEENSIFVYSGENGDTFADHNPTDPSEPAFLEELIASRRTDEDFAGIQTGCTTNDVVSTTCLYDTLTTNRADIGQNTLSDNSMTDENSATNANTPPTLALVDSSDIENGNTLLAMIGQTYTLTFTASDVDEDVITFSLSSTHAVPGATIDSGTGDVTFSPTSPDNIITSQSNISLSVLATDANNAVTMLTVNIKLCVCQNSGECLYNENVVGSANYQIVGCECTEAWAGDDCSEDMNGCLLAACFANVTCTDNVAPETGETCGDCPPGTTGDGRNCTNIDYCESMPCAHTCDPIYLGYICSCNDGYQVGSVDNTTCEDVNECDSNVCSEVPYTTCVNNEGSYNCECNNGFVLNAATSMCDDIDECLMEPTNNCTVATSTCVNSVGGFTCACKQNYTRPAGAAAYSECVDLDECTVGLDNCNTQTQTCVNLEPFYECQCKTGFTEVDGACQDIQECQDSSNCNAQGQICVELLGSFRCDCAAGYASSDGACVNIDECLSADSCEANTECIDTEGAYYCRCQPGSVCVVNPYIGPVTVLVTTDNSLLVLIDSAWNYDTYEVQLTSSTGVTTHNSDGPTLLIESLNPNTDFVVAARVTKLKDLAMVYSSTEYSTPVNVTTDAVTLPVVVTIEATFEPHLSDLSHPDTQTFINLHHDVIMNGLSAVSSGTTIEINGLEFVQFSSGSVIASAEARLSVSDSSVISSVSVTAGSLDPATYRSITQLTKPNTPTNFDVTGTVGQTSIDLTFDAVSGAISYQVEATCGSTTTYVATTTAPVTINNLPSGGVCSFRVRSLAGTSGVAYSDYSSPLIRSTNPSISTLIISNIQETSFTLAFDTLERGIDYTVSIGDLTPITLLQSSHVNNVLSVGITDLTQGTTYLVNVVGTANDISGNVVQTSISTINVTTTDVDECLTATCINAVCVNTVGSYMCECNNGYVVNPLDGNCQIGYCLNGATCISTVTLVPICNCPSGYEGSRCENLAISTILGIVFGILGGLLLVVIIVAAIRCYKRNSVNLSTNKL